MDKKENLNNTETQTLNTSVVRDSTYITYSAIWFCEGKIYDHQPFNIESRFVVAGH